MTKEKLIFFCNKCIEFSLCVLVYALPFSRAIVESAATTAIIIWVFKKVFIEKTRNIFQISRLTYPVFIYLAICILSVVFSTNIPLSFRHLIRKTLEYILVLFIVIDTVKDERMLRRILYVAFFIIGFVAIDGIFQYFFGWDFFRGHGIVSARVSGPFAYPNDFGGYLVTVIPLISAFFMMKLRRCIKIIFFIILFLLLSCLVLSASKSAWLALIIAFFIGAFAFRKKSLVLIPVCLLILACIFYAPQLKSRALSFVDFSGGGNRDRAMLWQGGWDMFLDRPVLGQGLGTYMYNFQKYRPRGYPPGWLISYPHNCFLQMAAEIGIFGVLAFLWMVINIMVYSVRLVFNRKEETFTRSIVQGLSIGLVAYMIHSFFDTNLYSLPLAMLFWVTLGLIVAAINIIEKQHNS